RERLRLWRPLCPIRSTIDKDGRDTNLSDTDIARIFEVVSHAWAESTNETYGSGLLAYHVFCDTRDIPELQRVPASTPIISSFAAALAGSYPGSTISNYIHGVRAWHILNGATWSINEDELRAIVKAAEALAPPSSKRKKRLPYTPSIIIAIRAHLDLNDPLDVAVFACLTTTFYAAARLGEFTVPRLNAFDASRHIKPSDVRVEHDRNSLQTTVFFIPKTKSAPNGEDVSWAKQGDLSDPEAAFCHHLDVNRPPEAGHLFAYRKNKVLRPLTKTCFLQRVAKAAREAGLDPLQGHGIRIGATLEYLLRGVPFDVMKHKGRWASDAFALYLSKHAQILAPYIQAKPDLHTTFVRYTMPPVR
ncbi:hypothetical protein EW146_g8885, partial [Bondarzewia mesenterica]